MGSFGDAAENSTLDAWLGSTTLGPATVYLGLYTVAPTDAGGGTEYTGCARIAVTNNSTNWPNASGGVKVNGGDIESALVTATGTIVAVGFFTASSGGNPFLWGTLTASVALTNGVDKALFAAGSISITLD